MNGNYSVYVFDTYAVNISTNIWRIHICGVVQESTIVKIACKFLRSRLNVDLLSSYNQLSSAEQFRRLKHLVSRTIANVHIIVCIPFLNEYFDVYSKEDGFFDLKFDRQFDTGNSNKTLEFKVSLGNQVHYCGKCLLVDNKGVGIISDIDETLKVFGYQGFDPLISLLYKRYEPIEHMPQVMQYFNLFFLNPVFHYVSGCPWQIIPSLQEFIHSEYPDGIFAINHLNITAGSQKTRSIFSYTQMGKLKYQQWTRIIDAFPERRFILLGDNGLSDVNQFIKLLNQYNEDRIPLVLVRIVRANQKLSIPRNRIQRQLKRKFDNLNRIFPFTDAREVFSILLDHYMRTNS